MWAILLRGEKWIVPGFWLALTFAGAWVNAASIISETVRSGEVSSGWPAYVDEFTSALATLALIYVIYRIIDHTSDLITNWKRFLVLHVSVSIGFFLFHVSGMVLLRMTIYSTFGESYEWDVFWPNVVYELRKDMLSYLGIIVIIYLWQALKDANSLALGNQDKTVPGPIKFQSGSAIFWIVPGDILFAQAAGNYIELHLVDGTTRLVRMSLSNFEQHMQENKFVRIHRSYVVQTTKISSIEPNGKGDFVVALRSNHQLPLSRRYRGSILQDI